MNTFISTPDYWHYKEVAKALSDLGFTDYTIDHIYFGYIRLNHAEIRISKHFQNGLIMQDQRMGIYDFNKHTFVD